jgi:hypothetical protein
MSYLVGGDEELGVGVDDPVGERLCREASEDHTEGHMGE